MSANTAPVPLIVMRERRLLQILDLGIAVLRLWWKQLLPPMVLGSLPWVLVNHLIVSQWADEDLAPFVWLFLIVIEAPWATAPMEIRLGGLVFGVHVSGREILVRMMRGVPKLLVYQFGLRIICFLFVITLVIMPNWLGFMNYVILLERHSWKGIFRRQSQLALRSDLVASGLLIVFYGSVFIASSWFGLSVFLSVMKNPSLWEEPQWILLNDWKLHVLVWMTVQFFAVVRFLQYLDSRIRSEGWDLQNRIRALIDAQGRTTS